LIDLKYVESAKLLHKLSLIVRNYNLERSELWFEVF